MKTGDDTQGGELDLAYHRALVEAAGSDRLSRTYATVQAETRLALHRLIPAYRRPVDLADEHFRLAALIEDAPLAEIEAELTAHFGDPAALLKRLPSARSGILEDQQG